MRKGCHAHIRRKVVVRDDAVKASTTLENEKGIGREDLKTVKETHPSFLRLQEIHYCTKSRPDVTKWESFANGSFICSNEPQAGESLPRYTTRREIGQ